MKRRKSLTSSTGFLPYKVYCDTIEEVQEAIESAEFIRPTLLEGCRILLGSDSDELLIAEIFSLDTYATIRISIKRSEAVEVLHKTLDWFVEREEYEECSEVKKLIDSYESSANSTPNVDTFGIL
jgi:hypothetical protein